MVRLRRRRRLPLVAALALLTAASGCISLGLEQAAFVYYQYGPDDALRLYSWLDPPPTDRPLVEWERAMAYVELGFYQTALDLLARQAADGEQVGGLGPVAVRSPQGVFLGEAYERAMVPTLGLAAALALQDGAAAAGWADLALATARQLDPEPAAAPSAWVLAALAYEAADRLGAAQTTAYEIAARGGADLAAVVAHLAAADPRQRSLVVVVLAGVGPSKSVGAVALPSGERVAWPVYDPARNLGRLRARIRLDDGPELLALTVEDLWASAQRAIDHRRDRLLARAVAEPNAGPVADGFGSRQEMIGWRSLPATIQVVRVPVSADARECTMEVVDATGEVVWDETFSIPAEWQDGPLFVLRRVP